MPRWRPNGNGSNGHVSPGKEMAIAIAELRKAKPGSSATSPAAEPSASLAHHVPPRVVATYPYVSVDGEVLYEVLRMEPKSFRQRRSVPGGYAWNLDNVSPVLYRLPELLKFPNATFFCARARKTLSASPRWT